MKSFKQHLLYEEQQKNWKEHVEKNPMLKSAISILKKIEDGGHKAYIVGGAVRDIISGEQDPHDIDIATNAPMEFLEKEFKTHDIGKNKDFGIVVASQDGYDFEIAHFRNDGKYSDGRRPDSVKIVMDFKDDASRRDFTINAMGIDKEGNIIDYFDGKKDIKNKILKTVGNAHKRFSEDYLRMLRAIRFSTRMGYKIDTDTKKAIKDNANNIANISSERVFQEIWKMAEKDGSKFADAILELKDTGLLQYIFPEVLKTIDLKHSPEHHPEGGVFDHIIEALRQNKLENPIINLGILFHDLGKLTTHELKDGKHTYYGHATSAIEIINKIADRLKMDNETRDALLFSAENHMKMHELLQMSPKKVLDLLHNKNWEVLLNVAMSDAKSRKHLFNEKEWQKIMDRVKEISDKFKGDMNINNIKKVINGEYVMKLRNMKPGKELGEIIKKTLDYIVNNNININDKEKIEKFIMGA